MKQKIRADRLLFEKGLTPSREKAAALIIAGLVLSNSNRVSKPSELLHPDSEIFIKRKDHPYVSRGGLKLEKALNEFQIPVEGRLAMDVGSSTGGFTDCLLRHGAKKVYAIDCGINQLEWSLRSDKRVVCMEKTNFRFLEKEKIADNIELIVVDVSFISLKLLFTQFDKFLEKNGDLVLLVKPQFEAMKGEAKKGIVSDEGRRQEILTEVIESGSEYFKPVNQAVSPITGKKKNNVEYLIHFRHA